MQTGYSYQPVGPGPHPLQPPRDESLPELSAHNSSAGGAAVVSGNDSPA